MYIYQNAHKTHCCKSPMLEPIKMIDVNCALKSINTVTVPTM